MSESEENHLSTGDINLLDSLINQFKYQNSDEKQDQNQEDVSKIIYNDYYKSQGINYIKRNISLNDPLLDLVFEAMAQNIKTPLEEWNDRFGENDRSNLIVYESDINY